MKKRLLILLYMLVLLLVSKMAFNYFYNAHMIKAFENKDYSVNDNILLLGNFDEPYIAHYNNGDVLYEQGRYEEAIEEYDKALALYPPKLKECPIRINKALSMVGTLGENFCNVDLTDNDEIEETIDYLYEAIDVLTEDGCANDKGTGHSRTAEKLKEQIEELIEELKNREKENEQTPTPTPSGSPTPTPSGSPTPDPNNTTAPTPSGEPSPQPSGEPNPTNNPSPEPTEEPNPTGDPTPEPSGEPSPTPSTVPTGEPSPTPSVDPTTEPSPGLTPTPIPSMTPEPGLPQDPVERHYQEIEEVIAGFLEESAEERVNDTQDYYELNNSSNWDTGKSW